MLQFHKVNIDEVAKSEKVQIKQCLTSVGEYHMADVVLNI